MRQATGRVDPAWAGRRADLFVCEAMGVLSRSQLRQRLVSLVINGRRAKASTRLHAGDRVTVEVVELAPLDLTPQRIPLEVVYEDGSVLVVNKPQGMVVHPGSGHHTATLVHAALHHCQGLAARFPDEPLRPGIVHRLDKDTSGVILVAKTPAALQFVAAQFRERRVAKQYVAIVYGRPPALTGVIREAIGRDPRHRQRFAVRPGGKPARTAYRVVASTEGMSFVTLRPTTGRTHQLRVHLKSIGCPIVGDPVYAADRTAPSGATLMLHARRLRLQLPDGQVRSFRAAVPERFRRLLSPPLEGPG